MKTLHSINNKLKKDDLVKWCGSSYKIVNIKKEGAILKQNFSINTVLIHAVPLSELSLL